ncbi:hypothetical protein SLS56_000028 [Neofusicoccum ribis]|uniref:Uncharacterized protein n=1 Tax=Neofusicoccum ribis TaxID=45134 RepID=A0ABR3TFF8_9PEZI
MLEIALALVDLPSISLKVDEDMWDNTSRLQFRHSLLPASVRHINIDLINTDKSLDATSDLPSELMEDDTDDLAQTLRDTARQNQAPTTLVLFLSGQI